MERNRLTQLDRLEGEGRVDVDEVNKATETAIRTVEQEVDLIIDLSKPISRWRQAVTPEGMRRKSWQDGAITIYQAPAKKST